MMWKHAVLIPPLSLGFVKPGVPAWSAVPGDPWERNRRAFPPSSSIWFISASMAF